MTKLLLIHIILIEKRLLMLLVKILSLQRQTIEADIDKAVEAINSDETVMSGITNLIQTDPSIIAKTDDGSRPIPNSN